MKRIAITGASGYIGRHVINALSSLDVEVITLDINDLVITTQAQHIVADILSPDFQMSDYLDDMPDACLHLAWRDGFNHNSSSHMHDLSGHYRFIEKLIECKIPQVGIMGTMHEVGYWEGMITGETPCKPQSFYGIAKDSLRRATFLRASGTDTSILWLRGFYIYGDDEASQSIFGKITRAASAGEKTFPFTTGISKYDFLSIDELAWQIAACIRQNEYSGIINCCSGKPTSLADQVERFIHDNNLDIALEYGAYPDRPYDSPAVWGDATLIRAIMNHCHQMIEERKRV